MPPAPAQDLTQLLASVRPGAPWSDRFGLSVIPLMTRDPPATAASAQRQRSQAAEFVEHIPARADAIGVRGRAGRVTIARLGQIIGGGMADRAVRVTTRINGEGAADLAVLPLEPRWWSAGGLAAAGVLPAPLLSLVALAGMGGDAVTRAGAQTAVWTAGPGAPGAAECRVRGFVLMASQRAVALHVCSHDMTIAGGVDALTAGHAPGLTRVDQLRRFRALIDKPGVVITVATSVAPLVEAWVLDGGALLAAVADHQG